MHCGLSPSLCQQELQAVSPVKNSMACPDPVQVRVGKHHRPQRTRHKYRPGRPAVAVCLQHRFMTRLTVGLLLSHRVRQAQRPAGTARCAPDPRFHAQIPTNIKSVLYGYQNSEKAGLMKEGFYWIRHNGRVQVAYYTDGETEDLQTGRIVRGIWHLTRGFDICDDGEAEVLQGPLMPPNF